MSMEVLWENAEPTSQFGEQTISLDLSIYKKIYVSLKGKIGEDTNFSQTIAIELRIGDYAYAFDCTQHMRRRLIHAMSDGVYFGTGHYFPSYGSNTIDTHNILLVPIMICGIK